MLLPDKLFSYNESTLSKFPQVLKELRKQPMGVHELYQKVISKDKVARFPSVYSQRAIDQLIKLSCLLDAGYNVSYIFVSLNPRIKQLAINEEIAEYRDAFQCCIKKGMKVKGVSLKLIDGEPTVYSSLPVST